MSTQALRLAGGGAEPRGLVTPGCEIRGRIEYVGTLQVRGMVEGEIISQDDVIIATQGVARARIQADRIRVEGRVEGDLDAKTSVVIAAGGEVLGDIVTPAIAIEEGGFLDGTCKMGRRKGADA